MPIEDRNLEAGTRLVVRHKKEEHTCEVVQTPDGLRYRLKDGKEFSSPSSAGREITGGVAVNGWRFWSLEGTLPERPTKSKAATKAKAEKPATKKAPAKKSAAKKAKGKKAAKKRAQRAAANGDSYGCGACGETFKSLKAATKHTLTHATA